MAIYDVKVNQLDGTPASLGDYKGKAVLIVNVASFCGLTPQYEGLQKLHETLRRPRLRGARLPVQPVPRAGAGHRGRDPGVLHDELRRRRSRSSRRSRSTATTGTRSTSSCTPVADAEGHTGDIRWNFEKFLVSPEGEIVGRFNPTVTPEDPTLVAAIEEQIPG